jgi:uncharacterized protein
MRMILDTNIWLDWLVFGDPSASPLERLASDGEVLATQRMLDEFEAVIARPTFGLDASRCEALRELQRSRVRLVAPAPDCRLACTDPDDQGYIDLAVAHRVDWLLTRDKALLRLRRHAWRRFGVRIGPAVVLDL